MNNSEILDRLTEIFRDVLDDDDIILTPDTSGQDIPDWDSANHINLIVATEIRFAVKFTSVEVERLGNVGDFVALIQKKLGAK